MAGKLIFVRHGETPWNVEKRFQGITEVPLNERGRRQAACAAKALRDIKLDAIYSSPRERSVETAEIIRGDRKLEVVHEDAFREMDSGAWEGLTAKDIDRLFPGQYYIWCLTPSQIRFKDGETMGEVQKRAMEAISRIDRETGDGTVLIVSHMVCLSAILLTMAKLSLDLMWEYPILNCAICTAVKDGDGFTVTGHNICGHLPDELRVFNPFGRKDVKKN